MKRIFKDNPYLFSILTVAFLARFAGIFHDLPFSYYPDEEHFVNRAVSFGSGDLNPHWFHKPAFLMYLLFFEYGVYYLVGNLLGIFDSMDDFAVSFFQSKGPFLLIGRITVALLGTATVYVTYLTGRDLFNRRTGLVAALFLSFAAGHVISSQVVKADVPSAFFTMLSFYFILRIYTSGRLKYYVLAGVFAGLGVAIKYYAVILLPTIYIAHVFYLKRIKRPALGNIVDRASTVALISFMLTFFIASPYNFLDPQGFNGTFIRPFGNLLDIGGKYTEAKLKLIDVEVESFVFVKSLSHYFSVLAGPGGMGEIGIVAVAGIILLAIRVSPTNVILLSFPILFIIIANRLSPFYSQPRHMNVIYPFMAIFAACFMNFLHERFQLRRDKIVLISLATILILIMPAYRIARHNYIVAQPNTRTLAKQWIESNIPAGSKILVEEEAVRLSPDRAYYEEMLSRSESYRGGQFTTHAESLYVYSIKALPEVTYNITFFRFPWWQERQSRTGVYFATSALDRDLGNPLKPVGVMPYEFYLDNDYEYAVVSNYRYESFLTEDTKRARNFPSFRSFYRDLFERGSLLKEFQPHPWHMRGPVVKVFKIR